MFSLLLKLQFQTSNNSIDTIGLYSYIIIIKLLFDYIFTIYYIFRVLYFSLQLQWKLNINILYLKSRYLGRDKRKDKP